MDKIFNDIAFVPNSKVGKPTEYVCLVCKQLRLSLTDDKQHCGKCGSRDIITGNVGSLDKAEILRNAHKT